MLTDFFAALKRQAAAVSGRKGMTMASDLEAQLFGEKPETPSVEQPPTEATPPQDSGPARDESGRFVAKTPEAPKVETPAPVVEQPKPQEQPKEHGGLSGPALAAVLDERDKRKKLEQELNELRSKQQPQNIPSIQDDPEAFAQHLRAEAQRASVSTRFELSETIARDKHGDDAVAKAMEWGMERSQQSPAFAAEYIKQKHPIDWVVRQMKRDSLLSELGDDDAAQKAFIERKARELGLIPPTAPVAPTAPAAATPQPAAAPAAPDPFRQFDAAPSAGGPMTPVTEASPIHKRLFGD
jgi:hypothetical protein